MANNYQEWLKSEFRSKVYNALSEVAFEFADVPEDELKKNMDEAIEWFQIHFYEE